MKGVAVRETLAPVARQLWADGLTGIEIASRLGVARSTAYEWIGDPDREKHRERRMRYSGRCVDCGARTDGSKGPRRAAKRCRRCALRHQSEARYWTRERIIVAFKRWAHEHGGVAPTATDWRRGGPKRAWPPSSTVIHHLGSWSSGVEAAALEPRPMGSCGRDGDEPSICADIREQYEQGDSTRALAEAWGVSQATIARRIVKAGGVLRPNRNETAARRAAKWQRRRQMQLMWEDGLKAAEIAEAFGLSVQTVRAYFSLMRAEGWDLPYAYKVAA
jgi:transposase